MARNSRPGGQNATAAPVAAARPRAVEAAAAAAARAAVVVAAVVTLLAPAAGCRLSQDGVPPPADRIFFPGGAMVDPQGRWLYVVNSNSDLRYSDGTIAVVDLDAVRRDDPRVVPVADGRPQWARCTSEPRYVPKATAPHECCWDYLDETILNCDEQDYLLRDRAVRIGSFGARPDMQTFDRPGSIVTGRMFLPVRGNNSITMVDVAATADDVRLFCTGPRSGPNLDQERFAVCDERWRLDRADDPLVDEQGLNVPEDQVARLPDEPYALAVDQGPNLLYVGHLRGGAVSMFDLGTGTSLRLPDLLQIHPDLLPGDQNGSRGVTSLTVYNPSQNLCTGKTYVSSRFRPLATSFVVYGSGSAVAGCDVPSDGENERDIVMVGTGESLGTGIGGAFGSEVRGVELILDENNSITRTFLLQRTPPALVAIDPGTSAPYAIIEVCQSPSSMAQHVGKDGPMLYITCFDAGEVYVVDPSVPRLRAIVPVGRGPASTVFDDKDPTRAYVVGFGANNVLVLDIDPDSPRRDRIVQRLGFPSATPRAVRPQ
jgi:hypothetical protein